MIVPPSLNGTIVRREYIHAVGDNGTGKSTAWLTILRLMVLTGTPGRAYVIDTDRSLEAMLFEYPDLTDRIVYRQPSGWEGIISAANEFKAQARRGDWVVVDPIFRAWDEARDFYIERVLGKDPTFFMIEAEEMARRQNLTVWQYIAKFKLINWDVIGRMYRNFTLGLTVEVPAHVFTTTTTKGTDWGQEKSREMVEQFERYGVKPRGHDDDRARPHTVLLFSKGGVDDFRVTTIKDRGRPRWSGHKLADFGAEYLLGVAGWKAQ